MDENQYITNIPYEIKHAETGISAIDKIISSLYKTGYIHNHARLWLASFMVHIYKISWKSGASWMYSHLLDGDLASNFLSWQWVAGTFSSKPYLFNSANMKNMPLKIGVVGVRYLIILMRNYLRLQIIRI